MSDEEKTSKLSEFDFEGDNVSKDPVVESDMMQGLSVDKDKKIQMAVGAVFLIIILFYFTKGSSSDEDRVANEASSVSAIEATNSVEEKLPPLVTDDKEIKAPQSADASSALEQGHGSDSAPQYPVQKTPDDGGFDHKEHAVVDDESWDDLEKEILAQSQSQNEFQTDIEKLVAENNKLNEGLDKNLEKTQQIDNKMQDFGNQLDSLKRTIDNFEKQFDKLHSQIDSIEKKLTAQAAEFFNQTDLEEKVGNVSKVPYSLYAVIPGRAWLKAEDNTIISVVEGQTVEHVGKVSTIDSRIGAVTFDNGKVLRQS